MTDRRRDPSSLSPRDARDKYLSRRQTDSTEESLDGWYYRLKLFVEWCDSIGIETVGDLHTLDIDEYHDLRSSEVAPVTLEGEMATLKQFLRFLEDLGAVEDGLAESVRIPNIDDEARSSDKKLHASDALPLIRYYRNSPRDYGKRQHAFLELAWVTGARQGGLRALDVRDAYLDDEPFVEFRHRPSSETPLKNKRQGERPVEITPETADVLQTYIEEYRYSVRDDYGRQPLLASANGRPTANTIRVWSYLATQPCVHTECPHGKERETCQWTEYAHASKCPSTRSPHQIRTGCITHLLNIGWPPQDVAERVNATVKTIEAHYDKAAPEERFRRLRKRMETRRRSLIDDLDPTDETNDPTR